MRPTLELVVNHPANAGLRRYLEPRWQGARIVAFAFPEDVQMPYMTLGTHPELVERLWDQLGKVLPQDCRAIFFGTPALVHPQSGVVIGFAGGTHTYALRLPGRERLEALEAGASRIYEYPHSPAFDLNDVGDDWVFCRWFGDEERWCQRGDLRRRGSAGHCV